MIAIAGVRRGEKFQPVVEQFVQRSGSRECVEGFIKEVMKGE